MTDAEQLKPCPFCGEEMVHNQNLSTRSSKVYFHPTAEDSDNCCIAESIGIWDKHADRIAAWNRRPNPSGDADVREAAERFREALAELPDVEDRQRRGQQFNAYEIGDDGLKALCIGPITSRPLSLFEAPADVADLVEAALRLAILALTGTQQAKGEGKIWSDVRSLFVRHADPFAKATRYEEASAIADLAASEIAALISGMTET